MDNKDIAKDWIEAMRKMYKSLNLKYSMHYGNQFYIMCREFGLDPEEVKKEVEK